MRQLLVRHSMVIVYRQQKFLLEALAPVLASNEEATGAVGTLYKAEGVGNLTLPCTTGIAQLNKPE